MSRPVILRPDAEADVRGIFGDLESIGPALADRFAAQLRATLERMEAWPECGGRIWKELRAIRVQKFRYVVYFYVFTDRTEVLAVLHGARDPKIWRKRTD